MSAFTCLSCHVAFTSFDGQREHFRTEWHRYNLMRKVAQLPPVSRETFNDRENQVETQMAKMAQTKEDKKKFCKPCNRSFVNHSSYENHMNSKKHMEKVASYIEESKNRKNMALKKDKQMQVDEADSGDDDMNDEEEQLYCKICKQSSANQVAFYNHMRSRSHMERSALFGDPQKPKKSVENAGQSSRKKIVEESDDDSDYEEVEWEGDPIDIRDCLFCSHHSASLKKKLEHMSVEHSFFIPDLEYCTDVSELIVYLGEKIGCGYECIACKWVGNKCPTLDAVQKHMNDKGHCFMNIDGDKLLEYEEFYDYSSTYPDAGQGVSADEDVMVNILEGDAYQLVLPSGATVGHRTLMRYYKQKLRPERSLVVKKTPGRSFTNLLSHYRALGWTGVAHADVVRKSKDLKFMQKIKSHHNMKLGIKANKLQHHFRHQNPV